MAGIFYENLDVYIIYDIISWRGETYATIEEFFL